MRRAAILAALLVACAPRQRTDIHVGHEGRPPEGKLPAEDPVEVARIKSLYAISMHEISRPTTPEGFAKFLADPNPSVRAAAARGVGRAGEALVWAGGDATAFADTLMGASRDKSHEVRLAVADAIALLGEPARGKLRDALAAETDADIRARWVLAAGRVAALPATASTSGGMALASTTNGELVLLGEALRDDDLAAHASWALGVYGIRSERVAKAIPVLPAETLGALRDRFSSTAAAARIPHAYALWRLRQRSTTAELRAGLADPDPRVRAWCARGLGSIPSTHAKREVARLLRDPNLWTRVEAARGLASLADADAGAAVDLVDLLEKSDPPRAADREAGVASPHGAIAAAEAIGDLKFRATAEPLRARLNTDHDGLFAAAVTAYVKVAGTSTLEDLAEVLEERSAPGEWRFRKALAKALGALTPLQRKTEIRVPGVSISTSVPLEAHPLFASLLDDKDERVRAAALESYAALAGADARERLLAALSSNDVAIVSVSADGLANLGDDADAKAAVIATLERLIGPDPETAAGVVAAAAKLGGAEAIPALEEAAVSPSNALMLAAAKALRAAGRTPPIRAVPPAGAPTEEEWIAAADLTRMTIRTTKGDIRLALRPDIAPLNVLNLTTLARKGYFRGVAFHRVVPAFVVQGGDPRSDGNGGPGHSVTCELSELGYATYAAGMALSGRDTGGSQFFFTLTPQPHLDRNYTVFGRVVRGADVVERIDVGDVIVDVTVP